MKHTEWLELNQQANRIISALRAKRFTCRKSRIKRLTWTVSRESTTYTFTWDVQNNWVFEKIEGSSDLIPALTRAITEALHRGGGRNKLPFWQQNHYPWILVQINPELPKNATVARFFNRGDAENHRRFLSKTIPSEKFEVMFEPPTS